VAAYIRVDLLRHRERILVVYEKTEAMERIYFNQKSKEIISNALKCNKIEMNLFVLRYFYCHLFGFLTMLSVHTFF
jgi:hypothetical protein